MAEKSVVRITGGAKPGYYVKDDNSWYNIDNLYPNSAEAIKMKYEEILKDKLTELRDQGKHKCSNHARGFKEADHYVVSIDIVNPTKTPNPYKKTEVVASASKESTNNKNATTMKTPSSSSQHTDSKKNSSSSSSRTTANTKKSSGKQKKTTAAASRSTASANTDLQSQPSNQNGSNAESGTTTTQILPEPTRSFVAINEYRVQNPKPEDLVIYEVGDGIIWKVDGKNGQIPELQQMVYNATMKKGENGELPTCESEWERYHQNGGQFLGHRQFAYDSNNKADWERYVINLPKDKVTPIIKEAKSAKKTIEVIKDDSERAGELSAARQTKIVNKKENPENVQIQTDTNAKGQKINVTLAYSSLQSGGRQ